MGNYYGEMVQNFWQSVCGILGNRPGFVFHTGDTLYGYAAV